MDTKKQRISTSTLLKSSFWYTVSNYFSRAIVFITTPLFTRLMTTEQYGDFSIFATWQSMLLAVCGVELYSTINRARFDYDEDELNGYISSCILLGLIITGIFFAIYLLFTPFVSSIIMLDNVYMYIMFAYLFAYPSFAMFQAKQRIEYRYKLSAAISFLTIIISSSAALFLAHYYTEDRLLGRIVGQYSPFIIVGIVFCLYFFKKSTAIKTKYWHYGLAMGIPLTINFLGSQLLMSSGRIIVKQYSTASNVAILSLAASSAQIIVLFIQSLNSAWMPWFFDKLNKDEYSSIKRIFRIFIWFIIFCTFCVLLIGPEIIMVLGGSKYYETVFLLPVVMLNGVFTALSSTLVNLETFNRKTYYAAVVTTIIAVINIALTVVGVKAWGYRAANYVTAISQIGLILFHYFITKNMRVKEILPFKDLMLMILITISFIPIFLTLYEYKLLRLSMAFVLFAAIIVVLLKNRKRIKIFLSEVLKKPSAV